MNKRVRKKQLAQKILKAVQSLNAGEAIVVTREYLHQVAVVTGIDIPRRVLPN